MKVVEEKKDNPQIVQWTTDLQLRWTSHLSGSSGRLFTGSKYYRVDDLRYELGMTFFLYGALLRELAVEVLSTGMFSIIFCPSILFYSRSERCVCPNIADMVEAGMLFRRAAGIYQHLAQNVLPPLQPLLPPDRSPESTVTLASIMSIICLAEAQVILHRLIDFCFVLF